MNSEGKALRFIFRAIIFILILVGIHSGITAWNHRKFSQAQIEEYGSAIRNRKFSRAQIEEDRAVIRKTSEFISSKLISPNGRFLILDEDGGISTFHDSLPDDLRAGSPSEVAAVGRRTVSMSQLGTYKDSKGGYVGTASRVALTFVIVDPVSGDTIAEETHIRTPPPLCIRRHFAQE